MRKWEENSNPTGKKAENEVNEFSQMNDSWCWDPNPWFCVVPELQYLQVNVQSPLVWNWSLPGSSYNSLTVSLNRLKQAGSPVSRAWEKCEYSGKLSLHIDFLCKNQQKCVGDKRKEESRRKEGQFSKHRQMKWSSCHNHGRDILILFFLHNWGLCECQGSTLHGNKVLQNGSKSFDFS